MADKKKNKTVQKSAAKGGNKTVPEDDLLKALGELEGRAAPDEDDADEEEGVVAKGGDDDSSDDESDESDDESEVGKSHTEGQAGMPDDTRQANGGFKGQKGASEDPEHFETDADEVDPSGGSMKSLVEDNDTLRKGFEVSAFLEELAGAQVTASDNIAKSVLDFQNEQRAFNAKLQKAIIAIGNHVLGMKKSQVEDGDAPAPAPVRPRAVLSKSQTTERFEGGEGGGEKTYSKSQVLDALMDLAVKSEIPALAVSAYEASDFMDPAFTGLVNAKLKSMFG